MCPASPADDVLPCSSDFCTGFGPFNSNDSDFQEGALAQPTSAEEGSGKQQAGRRQRVGLVPHYHNNISAGKLIKGAMCLLNRALFFLVLFTLPQTRDKFTEELIACADKVVPLQGNQLEGWREVVMGEDLDVMVYSSIGVFPKTFFLSFSRLSRVQVRARSSSILGHCNGSPPLHADG